MLLADARVPDVVAPIRRVAGWAGIATIVDAPELAVVVFLDVALETDGVIGHPGAIAAQLIRWRAINGARVDREQPHHR